MKVTSALAVGLTAISVAGCSVLQHAAATGPGLSARTGPVRVSLVSSPASYLGVREVGTPASYAPVQKFASATGVDPNLVLYFSAFGTPFNGAFAEAAYQHGSVPLVQLNPFNVSMKAIADGKYDSYLWGYAGAVRSFGHPVVIGFAHEMNGTWYPWGWGHVSPAVWKAAWRQVVRVFRHRGALNVTWLWTVSAGRSRAARAVRYWPGSNWVTWVGLDGYFYRRNSFDGVFGAELRVVRALDRHVPILISETAAGPVAGKVYTIPILLAGIARWKLLGLVWYDVAQHNGLYHQDWRIEGNHAATRAFIGAVRSYLRLRPLNDAILSP